MIAIYNVTTIGAIAVIAIIAKHYYLIKTKPFF